VFSRTRSVGQTRLCRKTGPVTSRSPFGACLPANTHREQLAGLRSAQQLAEALDNRQDLRLTRRAALSGLLVWAAGLAENPASSARFRRAA
jgi:hypothetical protein